MLTAHDLGSGRQIFLPYGTELGASGQIEKLQQALLALSQTGLTLANPGKVTGVMEKQTVVATLYVIGAGKVDVGALFKAWLLAKIVEAAPRLGNEVIGWFAGADEAYAEIVAKLEENAPVLTTAVQAATAKRVAAGGAGPTSAKDLLERRGRTYTATQALAPIERVVTPAKGKAVVYVAVGAATLAGLGLVYWLIK